MSAIVCANETLSFKTRDGREYKEVSVSRADSASITVMTDAGLERLSLADLPPELQTRFGYDRAKAAAQITAERQAAATRASVVTSAQTSAARFSRWDSKIDALRKAQLAGQQDAANAGRLAEFEQSATTTIKSYEQKLQILRSLISGLDSTGTSTQQTQRLIDAVLEKKIFIGMPKAFVLLSWGKPRDASTSVSGGGKTDHWHFADGAYVSFDEGLVRYISN